jgi:hypothetical protein
MSLLIYFVVWGIIFFGALFYAGYATEKGQNYQPSPDVILMIGWVTAVLWPIALVVWGIVVFCALPYYLGKYCGKTPKP